MKMRLLGTLFVLMSLAGAILFPAIGPAFASTAAVEVPACTGTQAAGTVVGVDQDTQTVLVQTETGLCKVGLHVRDEKSIAGLLGQYFGDISASSLTGALAHTQGCAVEAAGAYTWTSCDTEGVLLVHVTLIRENPDGTFEALVEGKTEPVQVKVADPDMAKGIALALEGLKVAWSLNADGSVASLADEIERYHSEGMGYGVLVKLYAMANENEALQKDCVPSDQNDCTVTPAYLIEKFKSGVGMGQLFKEYGKPEVVGVGQVRNADKMNGKDKGQEGEEGDEAWNQGQEQGMSQNHANPNAPGQNKNKPNKPGKNK